jgi:hypothetical protein
MTEELESEPPEFDDLLPDFDRTEELLVATLRDEDEAIGRLRETTGDWWNVTWTLALLVRGVLRDDPATRELLDHISAEARRERR